MLSQKLNAFHTLLSEMYNFVVIQYLILISFEIKLKNCFFNFLNDLLLI